MTTHSGGRHVAGAMVLLVALAGPVAAVTATHATTSPAPAGVSAAAGRTGQVSPDDIDWPHPS